jgi:homoserine dehydrogenase
MERMNIAILGCGVVGSGVAKILLEMKDELSDRAGRKIELKKIVDLRAASAISKYDIPKALFCGEGRDLTKEETVKYINEVIVSDDIDLIVETIGGTSDFVFNIFADTIKAKKPIITANKAMLAERGKAIFESAENSGVIMGYEASVCGAIPIIKAVRESFTGDKIVSMYGIMNGTCNYILSKMQDEGFAFEQALKQAQKNGYAEADPTLDISGYDAGHKLVILLKLAYGIDIDFKKLSIIGIDKINRDDIDFANEMECAIKLISFAEKKDDRIYAGVRPMMVKRSNFLSEVDGATNAVEVVNKYSGKHFLVGAGAGSLETASAIVSDIIFIARHAKTMKNNYGNSNNELLDPSELNFPYNIIFETEDVPGITGLITTAIGNQDINIDTVGHNRHNKEKAVFAISTMPCSIRQIENAVKEIRSKRANVIIHDPKVIPILF